MYDPISKCLIEAQSNYLNIIHVNLTFSINFIDVSIFTTIKKTELYARF